MDILRVKRRSLLSMQGVFGVVRSDRVKETKDLFGMRDKRDQGYSKCSTNANKYVAGHFESFTQLTYHCVVLFAEKLRRKMDLRDSPFSAVLTEHPGKIYLAVWRKKFSILAPAPGTVTLSSVERKRKRGKLGRWHVYKVLNWFS